MLALLLTLTVTLASPRSHPGQYRDCNENGPLDKDSWTGENGWNGLWRSFLRKSFGVQEDSAFIEQGLRDKDGNALITRYNIFNWSQFRCLPTEAGRTYEDNAEWLEGKLEECKKAVDVYNEKAHDVFGVDQISQAHRQEYEKLRDRAQAAEPLLRRVKNFFQRKAWIQTLFAKTEGTYKQSHMQLQYTDPGETSHNYSVNKEESDESKVVFERASPEACEHCPDRLVLSEQFANNPIIRGYTADGKPHGMNLQYYTEYGWRVHFLEGYGGAWDFFGFNNKDCTVKFLNFQDAYNQTRYY